jgi:hypothetical protein
MITVATCSMQHDRRLLLQLLASVPCYTAASLARIRRHERPIAPNGVLMLRQVWSWHIVRDAGECVCVCGTACFDGVGLDFVQSATTNKFEKIESIFDLACTWKLLADVMLCKPFS